MGKCFRQKPVKLVMSIIYKDRGLCQDAEEMLKNKYGVLEEADRDLDFDYTDYYESEMGSGLKRKLICFKDLVDKENIAEIKLESNKIEDSFKVNGKRPVNVDPGYVTEAKLVLLTTKDYTHRVYIGMSIFAELTLYYMDGAFKAWPWTYPDYASLEMSEYFNQVREFYMGDLKRKGLREF